MYHILVVEDDVSINGMLTKLLTAHQYKVQAAFSGTEALLLLEKHSFDLILLDLMLPGMSGEEVLEQIVPTIKTPVIGISAKSDMESKLKLLKNGADDYLTKPFNNEELLVRIEVVLRRNSKQEIVSENRLICGPLVLEETSMQAYLHNTELSLTKNEFAILKMLMEHPNQVFTKEMIYEQLWNEQLDGSENAINVHISNLRKKFAAIDSTQQYIKTIWGIGFKMNT